MALAWNEQPKSLEEVEAMETEVLTCAEDPEDPISPLHAGRDGIGKWMTRMNVFLLFRRKHDLTQEELARFLEVRQQSVQQWERAPGLAPEWARLVCEDPLLPEKDLERRLLRVKLEVYKERGYTAAEAEEALQARAIPFRAWRRAQGLTQNEAAQALGVGIGTAIALDQGREITPDIRERMEQWTGKTKA